MAATALAVVIGSIPGTLNAQEIQNGRLQLDRMHEALRSADVLEYHTTSQVSDPVLSQTTRGGAHVRIRRPNLFRADMVSGGKKLVFVSDGSKITIWNPARGRYAQIPARDDVLTSMNVAAGVLAIEARVLDFLWTARYVEQDGGFRMTGKLSDNTIGGHRCQGFAVVRDQDEWDVWLDPASGLPCRLVSKRRDGLSGQRQTNDFRWVEKPDITEDVFEFAPRKGDRMVDLIDVE